MFIRRIEIENFKCFKERISLDLGPNENQIELDIDEGYFVKRKEEDLLFSPIISIGGANAKGKGSILEALLFFCNYFNEQFFNQFLSFFLFENKIHPSKADLYFPIIFDNMKSSTLNLNPVDKHNILEIKKLLKVHFTNVFNQLSNNINEEVNIVIFFGNNDQNISLKKFSIEMLINQTGIFINYFNGEGKVISNEGYLKQIKEKIKEFCNNVLFISNDIGDLFSSFQDNVVSGIINNIVILESLTSHEKMISLIRLADLSIEDINFLKDENNVVRNINYVNLRNGSQINVNDLSTGTKKFIKILSNIYVLISRLKKENLGGLILIDEIETSLHFSLVNFFKKFVYQIAKNHDIQMFYTSHDPYILSSYISHKQIFLIEDDKFEDKRIVTKVSSSPNMRKSSSFVKRYLEKKIGSHPSENEIDTELGEM